MNFQNAISKASKVTKTTAINIGSRYAFAYKGYSVQFSNNNETAIIFTTCKNGSEDKIYHSSLNSCFKYIDKY